MIIKGTCQKQNLMQVIHDAILSPGSNWTEISSNKTNDFKSSGAMNDGWVFKSPPIGTKQQSVILNLKSQDFSKQVSQLLFVSLSDDYTPNATNGQNGTFTNSVRSSAMILCCIEGGSKQPTDLLDYFIDIQDHRILMVVQTNSITTTTNPMFLYVGYPELNTNLEGLNYTNQFIVSSCSNVGARGLCYWRKASNGSYDNAAQLLCYLNNSNPTPIGAYLLSPLIVNGDGRSVGDPGPLGVLSGLYAMPSTNIINGDIITIGDDVYQVFIIASYSGYTTIGGVSTPYYTHPSPVVIVIKITDN